MLLKIKTSKEFPVTHIIPILLKKELVENQILIVLGLGAVNIYDSLKNNQPIDPVVLQDFLTNCAKTCCLFGFDPTSVHNKQN